MPVKIHGSRVTGMNWSVKYRRTTHVASFDYTAVTDAKPDSPLPGASPLHTCCWPIASLDATSADEYVQPISLDGATTHIKVLDRQLA